MKKFQETRDIIVSPDNKFYKLLKKLDQKNIEMKIIYLKQRVRNS